MVRVSAHVPVWTGNPQMEAEVSLDRYAGVDLSFKLLYDGLIQHPGRDARASLGRQLHLHRHIE